MSTAIKCLYNGSKLSVIIQSALAVICFCGFMNKLISHRVTQRLNRFHSITDVCGCKRIDRMHKKGF